jgi:hypothetical protein
MQGHRLPEISLSAEKEAERDEIQSHENCGEGDQIRT